MSVEETDPRTEKVGGERTSADPEYTESIIPIEI